MTARVESQHLGTIRALATAIDARDPYTLGHSVRVGQLSATIGSQLHLASVTLRHLEVGGYLHDIGKIGIRDSILLKPGRLTEEERELIERHPTIGLEILDPVEMPDEVKAFVGGHHERLDGSEYPNRLTADDLAIVPRIGAVADFYDAVTTDRPYRKAMTLGETFDLLQRESLAGHLDPSVVNALKEIAEEWQERLATESQLMILNATKLPRAA